MAEEPITRRSTVEAFLKAATPLRVSPTAIDQFVSLFNSLAQTIAGKAVTLAQDDSRTTLLDRDVTQAFSTVVLSPGSGVPPLDPTVLFDQIDKLSNDQLVTLLKRIDEWLKAQGAHP